MKKRRNIIVAVTGASGSIYARLLCQRLAQVEEVGDIALIVTSNGDAVCQYEDDTTWMENPRLTRYHNDNLFPPPASGSAPFDAMVVIPCSMGMAGRIAAGISNDLTSRAADVMLKERRRLILVPREAPMSTIHLRNLTTLSECGAIICPAAPSFYSHPQDIESLCGTIIERVLTLLEVDTPHYEWTGQPDTTH